VLCLCIPVFLLHRLPYVALVSWPILITVNCFPACLSNIVCAHRLVRYTPQASIVRLLTINSINAYITSWVLYLSGGSEDPRLLLPAWITIATTLTFCYHLTQRKINIRKETRASISVFSTASFISMVALLFQLHLSRVHDYRAPLFVFAHRAWELLWRFVMKGIVPIGHGKQEL
jgi:hypothetical protein